MLKMEKSGDRMVQMEYSMICCNHVNMSNDEWRIFSVGMFHGKPLYGFKS